MKIRETCNCHLNSQSCHVKLTERSQGSVQYFQSDRTTLRERQLRLTHLFHGYQASSHANPYPRIDHDSHYLRLLLGSFLVRLHTACDDRIALDMSTKFIRTSARVCTGSMASRPTQRVSQIRRHLSSTSAKRSEIRDAYILSAARTPTGKVFLQLLMAKSVD